MAITTAARIVVQDVAFAAWGLAWYNNCLAILLMETVVLDRWAGKWKSK